MPNYRKKNQNYRNKNKNKNKNTSSSSVKQEYQIVEKTTTVITSSGNEPNLPADDVRNSYTTTSSANKSVFEEKNVVVVVNVDESSSISPLSNEEIDQNECNVDIDTLSVSEDRNTAQKQSNYSSTFNSSSSSKKSTEIEHHRQSGRSIFDSRDSTLGNSVIRDTLVEVEASSGKNSFKTGSANTKDAAEPATDTSSATDTQSIESTRISESVSEKVRNTPEKRSGSTESAAEVKESDNRSSQISSKVIVHTVVVKNGLETSLEQSTSVHQIPSEESSNVIVHQISKEDPSIHQPKSHVIVHREEQSSSTSHRASKNNGVDLSKKVISKQVSKKKAIRTNTSSLQTSTKLADSSTTQTLSFSNVRGQPSREAVYEVLSPISPRKVIHDPFFSGHGPSRAIIHQISKEEGCENIAKDISKVIVHQVSREEKQRTASSSETVLTQHILPQTTEHKVILHQISPSKGRENSSPKPTGIFDHSTMSSCFETDFSKKSMKDGFETLSERAGSHHPDSLPQNHPAQQQHKKVIIIPILQENATQTSPLPSFSDNPLHSSLLEIIKDESSQSKSSSDQEKYRQTSSSPLSRSPVICFENLSESFELPKDQTEENSKTAEGSSPASSTETLQEKITNEIERPIVQEEAQPKPSRKSPQRAENLEPLKIPSFPVTRPEKVIIHPILHEAPTKQSFPFSEKSIKSLDSSSKKMASQILKEVSSELKSSLLTKRDTKKIKEVSIEKVRTSFPISLKNQGSLRPGFFETNAFETEINPMDSESKVIVHHIFKENPHTEDLPQSGSKPIPDEKVIVHQISREETKPSESIESSKEQLNTKLKVKVITHQISQETSTSSEQLNKSTTLTKNQGSTSTYPEESLIEPVPKPVLVEEKVILHQISREETPLGRSPSFPMANNIKQETVQSNQPSSKKPQSPSTPSFPVSSLKIHHPEQYNSRSTILEQKTINCQALRDKSKFRQSSSTLTSPFAMTMMNEDKDQKVINHPILQSETSESGSAFPISAEKQKQSKFTTHPIFSDTSKPLQSSFPVSSGPSFPFSKEKEIHATQYFRPQERLQQTIDLQSLRSSSEFRQSSSTMTSTYGTTEMGKTKDQPQEIIHHVTKEESSNDHQSQAFGPQCPQNESVTISEDSVLSDLTTSSASAFPTSNVKEIHHIQYSRPQDRLQETIDLQSLRDSSEFRQSSSTMTSTFGLTEMGDEKDERVAKEIIHKVLKEESSSSPQAQSTDSKTFTPSDSSFPFSNDKEVHATQYLRPQERQQKSINLQSLRESSEFRQSSSTLTSTFGPTEMVNKEDQPESNVIIHKVVKEESSKDHQPQTLDHQTSQDGSVSSSEGSAITAIRNDSPRRSLSPPEAEVQKPKEPSKQKTPKSSFFLAPLELPKENHSESSEAKPDPVKIINHAIVRQLDKPLGYRVESPQPEKIQTITKKSKSFDDDDVVIQEMSDTSSAGDTDNPPLVSEAESETDTLEAIDEFPDTPTSSSLLSIQTLPFDHEDDSLSPKSAQDYKIRRQQNRAALESHFLPQFLAPNFLDSIKEENSDLSDSERRSSCSDRIDPPVQHTDLDDDVFLDPPKKANAVYPKSNLDFSKKHKHVLNVRPPKTSVIREEASPPSVVEAKIIDQGSIEESCSSWSTEVISESEAAEIVYIDSASSSVSDLLELDYSQGQSDESMDVRIQTPTIDLDSVNEMFATCHPIETNDRTTYTPPSEKPPPPPPVKEDENMNEQHLSPSHNKNDVRDITKQIAEEEQRKNFKFDEIISEKIETMSEAAIDTHRNADDVSIASASAAAAAVSVSDRAENSIANNLNSCDSAINQVVRNNTTSSPSVSAVGSIKNMENIREIVNASASSSASSSNEKSELDTIPITDTTDHGISKPNFMIGKPCSDHTLKCDTTSSKSSSSCTTTTTNTTTTTTNRNTTEQNILTLHDLCQTLDDTKYLNNPLVSPSSSTLGRQESLDSHGSDHSHSTNQSQCTAINQGSLPHCDWNEFDTTTDTTYVSESDTAAGLASSEASSPLTTKGGQTSGDETDSPPIRKLRSLCTEALASMPYGEEVLEELATVAQNIRDMPYPLPELPQIQDIQLSLGSQPEKSAVITLSQVPPRPAQLGQKFKSPPPPPVPEPPSKYDSWLGVPTESDPNVLVCLSPSQRNAVKSDSTADSLLDMHKKFVERRGYHEYTTKQVSAMNQANTSEAQKLNKIDSPPPPPLPPRPPVQSSNPNGNTDINDDEEDQNNHRLLAIIRDTHESQQQQQKSSMTSTSENISRRTEGGTHHTINTNSKHGGGGCLKEEFANSPGSVSKQSQDRKLDSESNKSHSEMQQSRSEHSVKFGGEPVLGMQFPTSDYFDSIFSEPNKRFSNIETGASSTGFCSQILATQPKRYSNIETSSFESKKCVENGKVLYDVSDSKREKISEGDQPDSSAGLTTSFPELSKTKTNVASGSFPFVATPNQSATSDSRPQTSGDSENIMSAFNLNAAKPQATAPPAVESRVESSPPAPPVPPLPPTFAADTTATSSTTTTKSTSKSESLINRSFNGKQQTAEKTFDDFRQPAKEAAAGSSNESTTKKLSSAAFQHEKLFKDFDDLSNLLKDELESGKRRPPATLDGSDIPSSVSDYNRVARESRIQSSHVSSTTSTETNRREQMKKLADEIDQTSKQRQQHRREMRIPIKIERSVENGPRSAPELPQQPKTYDIPVRVENGHGSTRPTLQHQRSYEIPIRVEHSNTQSRQRTHSEHQSQHTTHEVPIQVEKPEPERFRRAESMFNISDSTSSRHHLHHDDWMKYVGDLGSSENICKPFQREVEICYLGRRPNIRAPRMSASTSDLSSIHSYDTHGAYDVRRTTQTPRPQQPPRRAYLSTQSLIDTTPITPCVSSSRRSPAPERRSSLPREIHDKQLKYITSKEQQLKYEFERLENERRQLIDEMNRVQINQRINREAYRQRQLPPLTEDESFRQQMASEWLDKVAEREERRLQKIIKISKINQEAGIPVAPPRRHSTADDIGDEFLRRVKERRSKLCMPSDSDWESGAESQPLPRTDGSRSENEEPPVTVFEGQSTANIKQLPKHLREFAKLTSQSKQEHREEVTENSSSSATKKTSLMTSVKTTSNTNNNNSTHHESKSMQQDAAHVRDLEQLSHSHQQQQQGKRPKLVTILRHKKPAESCGSGGANSSCQHQTAAAGAPATPTATSGSGNNANSAIKRRKQTRFLLTPNRRSWSESDLLREIDKELVLAKGFLYANGVWTPKNQTPTSSRTNLNDFHPHNNNNTNSSRSTTNSSPSKNRGSENRSSSACGRNQKGIPTPPPPPLWTPQPERKQFRPVHFESPTLQRRYVRQQSSPSEVPSPPWSYTNSQPFPGYQSQSCTNLSQKDTAFSWPPPPLSSSSLLSKEPPTPASARAPTAIVNDPVVVEVEDDIDVDEGFAPTTSIAEKIRSFERSNSNYDLHRPLVRHNPHEKPAIIKPNEVIFSLKNEYMSEPETEYDKPKKMAQLSRRQYDGIGPTTKHGMPVILRSEVKEPNQHEWYKRIFQTIHKQKNPDDYVTIRYKCPRGRYPYKSNGYMSEPEPNYDSDYSTVKYRTLERRRLQSTGTGTESRTSARTGNESQDETFYGTMPNPVKSGQGSYKVQPGRIENYITGHSSVSEKEKKEWWDEVMDIFNGWLKENHTQPRIFIDFAFEVEQFQLDQQKLSPHYTEGNLSRALLKEQGYTSDSNLVFRKKDVPILQSPLSPVEQKQVYKSVQAGGQPPLLGFRKPAPEKPKETEFEYLPITPTLTKIRVHSKELVMSKNHQAAERGELICYPISNISRPIDVFAPFPKHVPSFIPLHQAPMPPNRKSSRTRTNSMGLRISSSQVRRPTSSNSSRHEACFQSKDAISPPPPKPTKYGTITLRKTVKTEPLMRSKSAGAVVSILTTAKEEKIRDERVSRKQQSVRLSSCSPVRNASRLSTLRATSRSPVAFGRSVSKERSFAEEKKRIEESLPSVRTDFTASTNILRDPRLKSPDQVKRAVRSYAIPIERSKSAPKVLPMIKPAMSSYVSTYVIRRVPSPLRKDSPKRSQASTPTRSLIKAPPVVRSKSQSSKLSDKTSSKPLAKTCSTVSLARTSSTFSVDSIGPKAKPVLQKKTLTISRPSSKAESEKPKRKPITISSSKSDSNVLKKIRESPEIKKKIIKAIPNQQRIVRTNHFFQNLFMRDTSPKRIEPTHQTAVQEKTRYWNTMTLPPKKSICDSKTITYRSLSPPVKPHFIQEYESVEHFHSEDECSEFGDRSGRTEDLVWQYEQRSLSEPRPVKSLKPVSDIARPESPGRACTREFSPTREIRVPQTREMRSPSRRRIENFRDSHRGETGKVIRASSLSSADDRNKRSLYNCDEFSHSANSLDYIERHSPSCRFSNSDRFIDLNRFYNTLERVGQLERATSATSLKPIRKEGEPLDFEEWRKIRFHERAERELSYLVGKLKEDQKEKDFLFRPKDVEDVKWVGNRDLSLKSKEKSVEDLRENFEKKIQQEWLDENKRLELESKKDTYKPYWRGSSVADLASNMEIKFNPESGSYGVKKTKSEVAPDKPLCLSNRLISTLSKDQVTKITQQLNEIYNPSEPRTKPDVSEKYVITVDKHTPANALKVRCNSSISKDELIGPVLRKKEASEKHIPSKKVDDRRSREIQSELTESEKKRLSQNFCREIQGKARSSSPNIVGRETRGAIAAENAKIAHHEIPPPPPLPKDLIEVKKPAPQKPKRKSTEDQINKTENPAEEQSPETEHSSSMETTIETPEETVSKKIQYFEERKFKEPPKTIYHAREDSSPDEDEIMRVIEANIKARAQSGKYHHQEMSSSVTDLKDLFGEKESSRINFPMPRPPPPPDETMYHETNQNQNQSTSLTLCASRIGSFEDLETLFRSRSISPQSKETSYLHRVNTGEVQKIKDKFESLGRPKKKKHFFALSPLRKVRSDPELSNDGSKDTFKTIVREHELGDVSCIAQKFEVRQSSGRGRSRVRKPGSPIQRMPLRKEDRLMPHIDIISKTASLKQEMIKSRSPSPARQQAALHAGEVERIRCIFETSPDRTSPVGQPRLGTSSPDLRDISPHLTASWIAHKFPRPLDNDLRSPPPPLPTSPPPPLQPKKLVKSDSMPIKEAKHHEHCYRSRSISPPKSKKKHQVISILKPRFDFFANQKFDPLIHRPKATYVPDSGDDGLKKSSQCGVKKTSAVKFKDDDDDVPTPPVPPTKGVHLPLDFNNGSNNLESPNRYFESDVNIHYKTPIRYEYKDPIPEEELAIRQAETMQKLYQEERRRKYLQELQDMTSRRHTDNFTPSQKSPIPLNRYDDFKSDLAPKSPNTSNYPRTVARALYNFQGQTARELTFKKGDVIYIRRQIDKNWYEGEHNAMIGLLPSNYVELLSKDGIRQPPKKPSEGQARAKYNFQAQSGIELSLNKGEHVTLTRRVDENWYEGKIANRKGIFPVSYVEVLVDIGAEDRAAGRLPVTQSIITQSSSSMRPSLDTLRTNINNEFNSLTSNGQPPNGILRETRTLHKTEVLHVDTNTEPVAYRALYKYRPQNTDELELQEGDIVFVLEKCDDGWFVGTSQRSGCFGTFPGNYVERV